MKIYNKNVEVVKSPAYKGWYSFKRLEKLYPNMIAYCAFTPKKGIGKSYSAWHDYLIDDINKLNLGGVVCRWKKTNIQALVSQLKKKKSEIIKKIKRDVEWSKAVDSIDCLRDKKTGQILIIFCAPDDFDSLKGMTIDGDLRLLTWYWDELFMTRDIYIKPLETIRTWWEVIDSLFRREKFRVVMAGNITNANNPLLYYLFYNLGWPESGQTIIDRESGWVIDNPIPSKFIQKKNEQSTIYRLSKIDPQMHNQLFGDTSLSNNYYQNTDLILYRLEEECNYLFSIWTENLVFHFLSYYDQTEKKELIYVTPQNLPCEIFIFAGDNEIFLKTSYLMLPNSIILKIHKWAKRKEIRYRDINCLEIIVTLLLKRIKKIDTKPLLID